ncbi:hypothetical protein B4140_1985 [Bacillus amyloliquefaciens]|nr:hypothetical protein B4140_1985 [Bacillus amyloliquefaciens]
MFVSYYGVSPVIRQGVFYTVLTVPDCEQFKTKAGSLNGICRQAVRIAK